jgi:hypothetical protein
MAALGFHFRQLQAPGSIYLIFMWLIGVTRGRFLSMIRSSKMAAIAAILVH